MMTFRRTRVDGNGTKQFGVTLWGNSCRFGFQVNFWAWEIHIMKERRGA